MKDNEQTPIGQGKAPISQKPKSPTPELLGYRLVGTGKEKVAVMHNWFCDCTSYDPMIPYLDTERFTYAFIDIRGYGHSKHLAGRYTVQEAAEDVLSLIKFLEWEQFHVVGHSMSGMIAQKIALDYFSRIKSVVALTPVPASGASPPSEVMLFLKEAARFNEDIAIECIHLATSHRYSHVFAEIMVSTWYSCSTPEARVGYLNMFSTTDFSSSVKGLKTPMQVVFAEHDSEGYEELMRNTFLTWYPNAQMECCPGSGHFPMQETPPYIACLIEKFLQSTINVLSDDGEIKSQKNILKNLPD